MLSVPRLASLRVIPLAAVVLLFPVSPALAENRVPPTPQQAAKWQKSGLLEQAGKLAMRAGDYADAATDLRRAAELEPSVTWTPVELGLALDYGGKQAEAFAAYQKGFGRPIGSTFGTNSPEMQEAIARFGAMCEDRGLHEDAVQCFDKARQWEYSSSMEPLDKTLDAKTSSPTLVRMMLDIVRGGALEDEGSFGPNRGAEAMDAFQSALKLAPDDPRPQYFLAYGLRRARRFAEAAAAFQKVSALDPHGKLSAATAKSLEFVQEGWSL